MRETLASTKKHAEDNSYLSASDEVELKREWGFWAILGFATTSLATWETAGSIMDPAFTNGGPVAVVYGFLCAAVGVSLIYASMAEMASILPIAGAQYHWTALFAPPKYKRFLSYVQGWTTVWAWQFLIVTGCYIVATFATGLATLNNPYYTPKQWHIYLLLNLFCVIECSVNIFAKRLLPILEITSGVCHVVFFFIIVITLLIVGKKQPSSFVWTQFQNNGGWKSDGISFCLGFLGPTLALAGADGCVHLAEECRDPTVNIPRALVGCVLINSLLGFGFVVVLLYSITDVNAAVNTPTMYPLMEILRQATSSTAAATIMTAMALLVGAFGNFAFMAGTSRLIWAFARDKGLPFSNYFANVNTTHHLPLRTLLLTTLATPILSLPALSPTPTALLALASLSTTSLYLSYALPIISFLHYRLTHHHRVRYGPWRLGCFGIAVNVAAVAFSVFLVVFLTFPARVPVGWEGFNYAAPGLAVVLGGAGVDWAVRGRKGYVGPEVVVELLGMDGDAGVGGEEAAR